LWILIIRTLYIYVSKDMRIRGYFSKPKGVLEQKRLGNAALEEEWDKNAHKKLGEVVSHIHTNPHTHTKRLRLEVEKT